MIDNPKKFQISIVIPCYNEENRIYLLEKALEDFLLRNFFQTQIILVNDGSTDETINKIKSSVFFRSLADKENFLLIDIHKNKGKGAAIREGVMQANGEFVLTLDADISTHPNELINWQNILNKPFEPKEIIIASRTHPDSILTEKYFRKITGFVFNFFVRKITNINFRDSQCGFKLYPSDIGKKLFNNLTEYGWAHDVEILTKAQILSIPIREMPVHWIVRDKSKVNVFIDSFKMIYQVIKIKKSVKDFNSSF